MDLRDKVAVVTEASSGIGAATARALVEAGARVALAARSECALGELAREMGGSALPVPTDVTDRRQVEALIQRSLESFGWVDVLVNNAGLGMAGPVATLDAASLERLFAVNVLGPLYAIQAAVPRMREAGGGVIVNVSSVVARHDAPIVGGYSAPPSGRWTASRAARVSSCAR